MSERARQARYDFARRREETRDRHFNRVWLACVFGPTAGFLLAGGLWSLLMGWNFVDFLFVAALASIPFMFIGGLAGIFIAKASARLRFGPDLRLMEDRCVKCGYDLRGSVSVVCPECGVAVADESLIAAAPVERDDGTGV